MNEVVTGPDEDGVLIFWCPGCQGYHGVWTGKPNDLTGANWSWNRDRVKPTFSPSILVNKGVNIGRCHSFVRDGMIQFLGDCDHNLKGQTVPLIPDPS